MSQENKIGYVTDLMDDATGFSIETIDADGNATGDLDIKNTIYGVIDALITRGNDSILYSYDNRKTSKDTVRQLFMAGYRVTDIEEGEWEGFGTTNVHVTLERDE